MNRRHYEFNFNDIVSTNNNYFFYASTSETLWKSGKNNDFQCGFESKAQFKVFLPLTPFMFDVMRSQRFHWFIVLIASLSFESTRIFLPIKYAYMQFYLRWINLCWFYLNIHTNHLFDISSVDDPRIDISLSIKHIPARKILSIRNLSNKINKKYNFYFKQTFCVLFREFVNIFGKR